MAKDLEKEVGGIVAKMLATGLHTAIPGAEDLLAQSDAYQRLKRGDLEALKPLRGDIKQLVEDAFGKMERNPFYGTLADVARSIVGAPVVLYGPGGLRAGVVTDAAAYSGTADDFPLAQAEPGTIGLWESGKRGGYAVACLAAHRPGEQGYVALLEVASEGERLGMNDIVEQFRFAEFAGSDATDPHLGLKVFPRAQAASGRVTKSVIVAKAEKKGPDCVVRYVLTKG